ncbi:hypothetical protein D3C87_1377570 [compost metagenome]
MANNNTVFNASMVLWKKELFYNIPKDFVNYKFCGDWLFWIELAKLGKVHISGRLLNYFRKHDNDVSGKAYQSGLVYIENLKVINGMYEKNLIGDREYARSFKRQYKTYWKQRSTIDPAFKKTIHLLFKNPVSAQLSYVKIYLSALWGGYKKH